MSAKTRIISEELLANDWTPLRKITFEQVRGDGSTATLTREVYDRGNAATVLPYDPERKCVLLVEQLRLPSLLQGFSETLVEACAGLLDGEDAEACAWREAEEELGYRLGKLELVFNAFMSPGSVSERVAGFLARYSPGDRISAGGGHAQEGEDIKVLEISYEDAFGRLERGEIFDGKTLILLQALRLRS
jgi:nudix-type nucleoside diphosphatase (YffH/AdpP family)